MNQILDYNPNKNPSGGSSGSDKVVRVFAVILAIFAICLLAGGVYGIYKNNTQSNIQTQPATKAQISIEQKETTALIKVTHDKVIEKLIYSWDSEKETTIKGSGESTMESEISLFAGEHTLNIKVVDIEGHETTFEQVISSENGEDKLYPVIKLEVTDEKKLRITATDETAIDFVTYRWNDDEEQKMEVTDDEKKIEFDIDILKGNNDLTIVAVDKSSNTTTETKSFSGVTKPDVTITIAADKKSFSVVCYHENGLKSITLTLNGQEFDIMKELGLNEDEVHKEVNFETALSEGNNEVSVKAVSVDETETVASEVVENQSEEDRAVQIKIEQSTEFPDRADVSITTEETIKEIKLNVNDVDYDVDLSNFQIGLVEGNNKITVTVVLESGLEKTETVEISH